MATYIEMPKLSDTMTEGTLVKWLKSEGDSVGIDEAVAEIETDKATMEMQSFDEGILHKIYVKEGELVPLGSALALVLAEGEEPPADADTPPAVAAPPETEAPAKTAAPSAPSESATTPAADQAVGPAGRIRVSPLAGRIAAEKGVDLSAVKGTGPGGRIVKKDVLAAAAAGTAVPRAAAAAAATPSTPVVAGPDDETIKLGGMRRLIAERLLESKTTMPHFYLHIEIDTAPMMKLRKELNAANEKEENGNKFTVNDFIMRAAVHAAVTVPQVNASFAGDSVVQYRETRLAVAVAIDDGLVTPVIREAQDKSLLDLSVEIKDLAERARTKKLSSDEMQGGTLTISNLGGYGIEQFDAIINPPQAMILSIGTIVKKPVVDENGDIVAGQRMNVGMSCDHRVIDGAVGATYLAEFKKLIETPALMAL